MKSVFLLINVLIPVFLQQTLLATTYQPDLNSIKLISCDSPSVEDRVITALPQGSGSVIVPTEQLDLSQYDRVAVRLTPLSGEFHPGSFIASLRANKQYHPAKFELQPVLEKGKPIEIVFNIAGLPREKVDFFRLYFNHNGKINQIIKFKLDKVEFYSAMMVSKLPAETYQRKLDKTYIFPRIQIKYSLFLNYYSVAVRDFWIERPLFFNRELAANSQEFKKKGNLESFRKNANIVSTYLDGFSILATSKSYLDRTLASMQYADKLGLKNFIMPEVSPAVTALGKNAVMSQDYDFIFKIAKAAEKSPSAFRINDKVVISSYNADLIRPEQWVPIIKELKKQNNDRLLFMIEIRTMFYPANSEYIRNGGKISLEKVRELKNFIRSYLNVADGMLFAGCNHIVNESPKISSYEFGDEFYKNILIPTIISVFNEPEYRSKYLGLSAAKGYFYTRHAAAGQSECGTQTLRQSLEAALGATPDFIIMPEWNEANENTHIEPTVYDSLTNQRVINHYRKAAARPEDNSAIPNLLISYRSELVYGENLTIELLNLPDPDYKAENVRIELCLEDSSGKVIKRFAPLLLSNRELAEKTLDVAVDDFCGERVLIPGLSVSVNGEMRRIKGLSCIMLKSPPNMNKKYVKQPIRDLCDARQTEFRWDRTDDGIKVNGIIETGHLLNTVELLENNIPVAAVDVKQEYQCGPDEVLLRFCWNSSVSSDNPVSCVIRPISGSVSVAGHRYVAMSEAKREKTSQDGASIKTQLRFNPHIEEFFFKANRNSELEISVDGRKVNFTVAELIKFGIYRKVFSNDDMIAVEQVLRLPEVPYPVNKKCIDFTLAAKSIFANPVYTVRAIASDGKMFRSAPFLPEKLSGRKISMNVWSYSRQQVVTLELPEEYGNHVHYDFTPEAGDVLPTAQCTRFFYGKLGGFDVWSRSFNAPDTASAPAWKIENGRNVLAFDGVGNYLTFPPFLISEQSFTIDFSLMTQDHSKQVIFQTYSSAHPGFQLLLEDGHLSGYFLNRKGKGFKFQTKATLTSGKWYDIQICYDMKNLSFKVNDSPAEAFECNGLLYRQPCLIFGGSYPPRDARRFKGLLRSFSVKNYTGKERLNSSDRKAL